MLRGPTAPMKSIRKILVGLELNQRGKEVTAGSAKACGQAAWLAKELGASIHLIHSTWSEFGRERPVGASGIPPEGFVAMEALADELKAEGVACTLEIVEERSWFAITHTVLSGAADLVVVGKREEVRIEGRRLGAVSVKLLRKCPCPVWTVKPDHDLELKLILAATDRTPVGDRALESAAFLASRQGGELHVVHAYPVPLELAQRAESLSEEEYAEHLDALRARAQEAIEDVLARAGFEGEPVIHLNRHLPSAAIKEAVEHLQPDLLVMGTVSRGGVPGFLTGSTAEKLLEWLDCSLLGIKPDDFVCPVEPRS